ncbi:hypothetical protein NCC49_004801 [Naganishia albida]|nr:hypothetical protein NCC49_004801 [Naganishia albida]
MFAINTLAYYTTLVLALTQLTTTIAGPTRTTKRAVRNSVQAVPKESAGAARLHQTSWRQIQARSALRMSPMYRRQQGSALPALTCPETFNSELGVARYPNIDILGGDQWPVPGPIYVETENDCLSVCQGRPGCIGYFWWATRQECFPKDQLTLDAWTFTSEAAQDPGSATGLIGDCAVANGAIYSQFRPYCCNSPAVYTPQRCGEWIPSPPISVARLQNTDLFGWDMAPADGQSFQTDQEVGCLARCWSEPGCTAYFWWPTAPEGPACFLKQSGWGSNDFISNNVPALSEGSVAGILYQTCDETRGSLTDDVYQRCCNN